MIYKVGREDKHRDTCLTYISYKHREWEGVVFNSKVDLRNKVKLLSSKSLFLVNE